MGEQSFFHVPAVPLAHGHAVGQGDAGAVGSPGAPAPTAVLEPRT